MKEIFITTSGVSVQVIGNAERKDKKIIRWLDETSYEDCVWVSHLYNGKISNPYHKNYLGLGYLGEYAGRTIELKEEYSVWGDMMHRGHCPQYKAKKPTYKHCQVLPVWHSFTEFCKWTENEPMWKAYDWELDKDLLIKGNLLYSPDHCLLLPKEINQLLVTSKGSRGKYPIGVSYDKSRDKYMAQGAAFQKSMPKKRFLTVESAFQYYKENKEQAFKDAAEHYKSSLHVKAYNALLNRVVEITD